MAKMGFDVSGPPVGATTGHVCAMATRILDVDMARGDEISRMNVFLALRISYMVRTRDLSVYRHDPKRDPYPASSSILAYQPRSFGHSYPSGEG
jgi:hypothetical protein